MHNIEEAAEFLRQKGFGDADVGVVMGTGLGGFARHFKVEKQVVYGKIPHFPVATMEYHAGKLLIGTCHGKKVIAMQGRFHHYEGYSMKEVTFPIRVMKMLGIKHLLLSNAAGGINLDFKKGDLVMLEDHINLQTENPLRGPNVEFLGPRFPDMSEPYSKELGARLMKIAKEQGTTLLQGVYVAVNGPNFETRAEYRYLNHLGADMVGMSTVPEVIVACHMGIPVVAVSVITDECDPDNLHPVDMEDLVKTAEKADEKLSKAFAELIGTL